MQKISIIAAACLVGLLGCGTAGDPPAAVVKNMYAELLDGNSANVLTFWSETVITEDQKPMFLALVSEIGGTMKSNVFTELEITKEDMRENQIRVFVVEKYENGREMKGNVTLKQEDGTWKVDGWTILGRRPDKIGSSCINWPNC